MTIFQPVGSGELSPSIDPSGQTHWVFFITVWISAFSTVTVTGGTLTVPTSTGPAEFICLAGTNCEPELNTLRLSCSSRPCSSTTVMQLFSCAGGQTCTPTIPTATLSCSVAGSCESTVNVIPIVPLPTPLPPAPVPPPDVPEPTGAPSEPTSAPPESISTSSTSSTSSESAAACSLDFSVNPALES
jgi:hypothetical protein